MSDAFDAIPLIDAWLDGEISTDDAATLDAWIAADPSHAERFTTRANLHARLRTRYQTLRGEAPQATSASPHADAEPAPGRSVWYAKGFRGQGSGFSFKAAIAALILIAAALLYVFLPSTPRSQLPVPHSNAPSFAILSDLSDDATFADGERSLGADLTAPIRLIKGRAQIMFKSTAVVDLTGPCTFEMTGPNCGRLHAGKVSVLVRPEAHGFTLDAPDHVRIIDLGTAFRAEADETRGVEVAVTQGHVRIERTAHDDAPARQIELAVGDICRSRDPRFGGRMSVAHPIEVTNPSFEADERNMAGGPMPRGWRSVIPGRAGCEDHLTNGNFTTGVDGRFVGLVNYRLTNDPSVISAMTQNLADGVEADSIYELTVAVGRRIDHDTRGAAPTQWAIALCDAATGRELASTRGQITHAGVMTDQTLVYIPADADAGRPIQIRLINPQDAAVDARPGQINFDAVRLMRLAPVANDPVASPAISSLKEITP
ncbi:MAG: hypothetical protein GC162_04635 [Planctomycetes bacterium]|nr:hypothetical protein [Planctomycetota bacterium]